MSNLQKIQEAVCKACPEIGTDWDIFRISDISLMEVLRTLNTTRHIIELNLPQDKNELLIGCDTECSENSFTEHWSWDLTKDLAEQSEETLTFLAQLLR